MKISLVLWLATACAAETIDCNGRPRIKIASKSLDIPLTRTETSIRLHFLNVAGITITATPKTIQTVSDKAIQFNLQMKLLADDWNGCRIDEAAYQARSNSLALMLKDVRDLASPFVEKELAQFHASFDALVIRLNDAGREISALKARMSRVERSIEQLQGGTLEAAVEQARLRTNDSMLGLPHPNRIPRSANTAAAKAYATGYRELTLFQFTPAAAAFEHAQRLAPGPIHSLALGVARRLAGDFPRAARDLDDALARSPAASRAIRTEIHSQVGILALTTSDFVKAERHLMASIAEREKSPGGNSAELARDYGEAATLYIAKGDLPRALANARRALQISQSAGLQVTPRRAERLATVLVRQGDFEKARENFNLALQIQEKLRGSDDPELIEPLLGLAQVAFLQERFPEVSGYSERARDLIERRYGPEHPLMGRVAALLSLRASIGGARETAELWGRRALLASEKVFGPIHQNVAAASLALAMVVFVSNTAESLTFARRGLTILETVYGVDHVNTVPGLEVMAFVLMRDPAGPEYAERAVKAAVKAFGEYDPYVAARYEQLARSYVAHQNHAAAIAALQRSIAIRRLGSDRIALAKALAELGTALRGKKDEGASQPLFEEAQNLLEEDSKASVADLTEIAYHLGSSYLMQSKVESARLQFEKAIAAGKGTSGTMSADRLGIHNFHLMYCNFALAKIMLLQESFTSARLHAEESLRLALQLGLASLAQDARKLLDEIGDRGR